MLLMYVDLHDFFFNDTATTEIYPLSLHDALPIYVGQLLGEQPDVQRVQHPAGARGGEVELEVALAVPAERPDPAVLADAQGVEHTAEPPGPLRPLRVRGAGDAARPVGDDRGVPVVGLGVPERSEERRVGK